MKIKQILIGFGKGLGFILSVWLITLFVQYEAADSRKSEPPPAEVPAQSTEIPGKVASKTSSPKNEEALGQVATSIFNDDGGGIPQYPQKKYVQDNMPFSSLTTEIGPCIETQAYMFLCHTTGLEDSGSHILLTADLRSEVESRMQTSFPVNVIVVGFRGTELLFLASGVNDFLLELKSLGEAIAAQKAASFQGGN